MNTPPAGGRRVVITPESELVETGVPPYQWSAHIAMLRLGPVTNLELFDYTAPDQRQSLP